MPTPEPTVSALINVAQAIRIIDSVPVQPRTETKPLEQTLGRRLAQDIRADRDYPPFRKSLMDGYAVRCQDVAKTPVELKCVGRVSAGKTPERAVGAGEAIAVMTGAPMPEGADGVVPVEDVEQRAAPGQAVKILRAAIPNRYIARPGSDCPTDKLVLRAGTIMGAAQIAVAASVGASTIPVYIPPHVAVLGTGDELVSIDAKPSAIQIRNSNTPMLASLLRHLGAEVTDLGFVRDDPPLIRQAILQGMSFEALFVTGGMSMGEFDYVPKILQELGVELMITKLKVKPGKPFLFGAKGKKPEAGSQKPEEKGTKRDPSQHFSQHSALSTQHSPSLNPEPRTPNHPTYVFGLPGNPVSSFVCTMRLASRLLTRMGGGAVEERWLTGRLDNGLVANGAREFYQPAIRTVAAGAYSSRSEFASITPLDWKGSADIFTLAKANVMLVRAENEPPIPKGTIVRALEI